jgi:hypothetical protein
MVIAVEANASPLRGTMTKQFGDVGTIFAGTRHGKPPVDKTW